MIITDQKISDTTPYTFCVLMRHRVRVAGIEHASGRCRWGWCRYRRTPHRVRRQQVPTAPFSHYPLREASTPIRKLCALSAASDLVVPRLVALRPFDRR